MGILLAFAPFIVFAILDRTLGALAGLVGGALASAGLLAYDRLKGGRSLKVLEVGTFGLFAGLALYASLSGAIGSIFGVRLLVDTGLLIIVLGSIALRRPFTLQYAREHVAPAHWSDRRFVRANYVVTAGWAVAFAVLVIADLILVFDPALPKRFGIVLTIAALFGAFKFTNWYPAHASARERAV